MTRISDAIKKDHRELETYYDRIVNSVDENEDGLPKPIHVGTCAPLPCRGDSRLSRIREIHPGWERGGGHQAVTLHVTRLTC